MLAKVLSIDLACKRFQDFGFCLIEENHGRISNLSFPSAQEIGLSDLPEPRLYAERIWKYCRTSDIHLLLMDGPQGWQDPKRKEASYRFCEKLTRTPGKTGVQGIVKPKYFKRFAEFSIALFDHLRVLGASQVESPEIEVPKKGILIAESFPTSAWRRLCLLPLPGKKKATSEDITCRLCVLEALFEFDSPEGANHDNLQALVAGLAGGAILAGNAEGYVAEGFPPKVCDGIVVEGFIVNPRIDKRKASRRSPKLKG